MDYPLPVFLAVLGAAALHATWNAWVRGGSNPLLHTAALVIWTGVIGVPVAIWLPLPHPESWPLLALSIAIHVVYYFTLARAYTHGALSVVYPIMRGGAPVLVSLGTWAFIGESLSPNGWVGVLLVSLGVLAIAFKAKLQRARAAIGWAVACSVTIATYSIVDGQGARLSQNPLSFTAWLFILESVVFTTLLSLAGLGRPLASYIQQRFVATAMGGVLSAVGYAIVLWAMTEAPMALVSATRETSVLFAALLGVWLLKERLTPRQWAGACVIVVGLIALRL
ncbi:EamA family transporter [Orrella daihaiensis]|uniref:EamA family transporter n=1 Tax=Orrella daihaiensis TaxID=2782176 RepID=A0ABY4ALL0_9BURK|nr:EamA family transporter [Orrella daihaiensis]UOD51186.1 EamA family transporter [Orrella daihaiensis]